MITKIHIQNFQSHKDTTVEFDKGVNVFTGRSDSGKSAVWRAIYWVAMNSPSGEAFRSSWGGDTLVELWLDSGVHIQRIRTNSENKYVLNGKELKCLRTEVPDEIRKALNLSDANFQGQMEPSFLLSVGAGEVARVLNEYLDLDSIDRAISNINGAIRTNSSEQSRLSLAAQEYRDRLEHPKFTRLASFETRLKDLGAQEEALAALERRQGVFSELIGQYTRLKEKQIDRQVLDPLCSQAKALQAQGQKIEELEAQREELETLCQRAVSLRAVEGKETEQVVILESRKAELLKDSCPVCGSRLRK